MQSKLYGLTVCALESTVLSAGPSLAQTNRTEYTCERFHKLASTVKRIAESTVRRLSAYLRFLEESAEKGVETISSDALARRGGTTSAQVRKDLSFFGSFGKRGLGYSVPELTASLREILGLGREWNVIIIGAGKIGMALGQYHGFEQRGFRVTCGLRYGPEEDRHAVGLDPRRGHGRRREGHRPSINPTSPSSPFR